MNLLTESTFLRVDRGVIRAREGWRGAGRWADGDNSTLEIAAWGGLNPSSTA